MEIKKIGNKTIYLKGKKETVLVNPTKDNLIGSKYGSRIIAFNKADDDFMGLVNDKVVIKGAGEYEIGGIEVLGVNGKSNRAAYVFNVDGVRIGIIGEIGEEMSDKAIEKVEEVDVLITSVSSKSILSPKKIKELAKKWGANYLIPMDYDTDDQGLKQFLDELDSEGLDPELALKVEKDNLPDGMKIVILKNE